MKSMYIKVAGVTFEGRQEILKNVAIGDPVRLEPEPLNPYDPNAIAVYVPVEGGIRSIGYVPRELAKIIAPVLEGEPVIGKVYEVTGGFEKWDGSRASLGCLVRVELPDTADV